jgi:hypothetical protein
MVEVWNECQERETYHLSQAVLNALVGATNSGDVLVRSQLAVETKRHGYRIKGTKGRTEWLKERRKDGKRGGRPKKTLGLTIGIDGKQRPANPPAPAPAPAPAQKQIQETSSNPPLADVDALPRVKPRKKPQLHPKKLEWFVTFYEVYPRHEGRAAALKAFVKLDPDHPTMVEIADDIDRRLDDGSWQPDDPERVKFIPLPASYLNGRRWEDGYAKA